jgi:Lar family restriction alleviation protein
MTALLPCPFCGQAAYSQFIDNEFSLGVGVVECGGCGVEMQGLDETDAIECWNTRTAQGIETRSAIDPKGRGPQGESPVANGDAPKGSSHA